MPVPSNKNSKNQQVKNLIIKKTKTVNFAKSNKNNENGINNQNLQKVNKQTNKANIPTK